MNNSSLTHFFRLELEKVGYRDLTPSWSLGHCQGDGVAFYGTVRDTYLLVSRLMPELAEEQRASLSNGLRLEISSNSNHYSHAYTMNVDADPDGDDETKDRQLGVLVERVLEDVRSHSRRLEELGYGILDAASGRSSDRWEPLTRSWRRGEFTVTAEMLPAEDLDLYESGEDEYDHRDALSMAAGELVAYDVLVTVRWRARELAQARCCNVSDRVGPDAPPLSFKSVVLELLRECRIEIRDLRAAL